MRLAAQQRVISLIIPEAEGYLLTASENGFGKRTPLADFQCVDAERRAL